MQIKIASAMYILYIYIYIYVGFRIGSGLGWRVVDVTSANTVHFSDPRMYV